MKEAFIEYITQVSCREIVTLVAAALNKTSTNLYLEDAVESVRIKLLKRIEEGIDTYESVKHLKASMITSAINKAKDDFRKQVRIDRIQNTTEIESMYGINSNPMSYEEIVARDYCVEKVKNSPDINISRTLKAMCLVYNEQTEKIKRKKTKASQRRRRPLESIIVTVNTPEFRALENNTSLPQLTQHAVKKLLDSIYSLLSECLNQKREIYNF